MKILRGGTWKRRGVSVVWDAVSMQAIVPAADVLTLRQFVQLSSAWPEDAEDLPGGGDALVVAGLKGALEVLSADDAQAWLRNDLRRRIISFQDAYDRVALILWFPMTKPPFAMSPADGNYIWNIGAGRTPFPFGNCLWTGAERDVERIVVGDGDADGPGWVGLYHPRIS